MAQTQYNGAIAACGLAQGFDLPTSVMPFILRGVALLGVNSVMAARERRIEAWDRIASQLDHKKLDALTTTIGFDDIVAAAKRSWPARFAAASSSTCKADGAGGGST